MVWCQSLYRWVGGEGAQIAVDNQVSNYLIVGLLWCSRFIMFYTAWVISLTTRHLLIQFKVFFKYFNKIFFLPSENNMFRFSLLFVTNTHNRFLRWLKQIWVFFIGWVISSYLRITKWKVRLCVIVIEADFFHTCSWATNLGRVR